MHRSGEPYRIAIVVADECERRCFAGTLLEEAYSKVIEASSPEEALRLSNDCADELAFVFIDLRTQHSRGADLAMEMTLRCPQLRIAVVHAAPHRLPVGVAALSHPWYALDLLIEAERAVEPFAWNAKQAPAQAALQARGL